MGRAAKWLVICAASAVAFGLSLWLAAAVKLPFLPKADADRWVVNAAFATAMTACVLACGAWWAARESRPGSADSASRTVTASGDGSIAVGGNISGSASTGRRVASARPSVHGDALEQVAASGSNLIAASGDSGSASTGADREFSSMTRRSGQRGDRARPNDSSTGSMTAAGLGAAAVGGDASGIVSTGPSAINVQLRNLFVTADAPGSSAPVLDADLFSRGPVVVGDVPQEPPAFQLREDLTAQLGARRAGVSVVHVVTGMRGVGKTQLAAAYARSCLTTSWRLVAWVDAGDMASVLAGLGAVAAGLGMRAEGTGAANVAAMVRHWLEADGEDCLVVFDNAVDIDGLRPYLPAAGLSQIVITSTRQTAANLGSAIAVDVFTEPDALAFLAARTGLADDAGARELADEMGRLPLGLAQAAALIAQQRLGYGTYLERLRAVRLDDYLERVEGDPYPHRVAEAVVLSLEAAEAADCSGASRGVIDLISILSPAGVSRAILHSAAATGILSAAAQLGGRGQGRDAEPEGLSSAQADRALGQLADWSLLSFSVDGLVISAHRLIKRVVRERRIAEGTFAELAALAADLLANLSDIVASRIWEHPTAAWELVGQISALHDHTAGYLDASADALAAAIRHLRLRTVWLVNTLADRPVVAITIGQPLVAEYEQELGADHPDTLTARNNLATAYQEAGKLREATSLFERTLADRLRVLGADHPLTLASVNNLAGAYHEAGRLDEAVGLYEAALADRERVLGADHPETLATRGNLAMTYHQAGRQEQAIALLEPAVADSERTLGTAHPRTLTLRNNLASAYLETGRLTEAVGRFSGVLADRERVLGDDHPETLASRSNLATAYEKAGQLGDAIALLERTLAGAERVLGPDHPGTLTTRVNLAGAYQAAGRLGEAIALLERALADAERAPGNDHPRMLPARAHLAVAYQAAGRLDEAISLLERAVADAERVLGTDNPGTLITRTYLAGAYQAAGRLGEAIPLFERALTDSERALGADHLDTLTARANLAGAYYLAGRAGDAIRQGERIVADNQRILGADHPETLSSRNNLATAYGAAGQLDQAIDLLERTLADTERLLGADHRDTLTPRTNLGAAYQAAGRLDEAVQLLERALAYSERVLGADDPGTLTSRVNLAVAYQVAGRLEEAIRLFEQAQVDCQRVLGADHPLTETARSNATGAAAARLSKRQDSH